MILKVFSKSRRAAYMKNNKGKVFVLFCACAMCACNLISAGSYSYAEKYRYKTSEESLIHILKSLKESDITLSPPQEFGFKDGRHDSADYWYFIYFHDEKRGEIILTWVRSSNNTAYTDFAFVGVKKDADLGNWKNINKDFDKSENKIRKEEFKALILNRIPLPIESGVFSNFVIDNL